jgi:hypothetical protein
VLSGLPGDARRAERTAPRLKRLLALLPALVALALPVGASASRGPVLVRLSNLRTVTRWAYPSSEALVRALPSRRAAVKGQLRYLTGDGQAQLYVALLSARFHSGQSWIEIELPGRPNGQTGWVPRSALESLNHVDGYLLVDQTSLQATLFRNGQAIFSAPIGVGKEGTVTPSGRFYVVEKLTTLDAPLYGPYAVGTSAYAPTLSEWPGGGVVGIHGTDEPQLIPGRPSHGCVRMLNPDITRLWSIIALGTPIEIT